MKLSFIVTTYNLEERLIRRCIRSISRQGLDNEDYEILVVDDESDVSPQPLIDELAEELPIRFFRQSHARQGAARNLALKEAKGDYIQFVDGDDYLFSLTADWYLPLMEDFNLDVLIYGFERITDPNSYMQRPHSQTFLDIYSGQRYMKSHTVFGSCCTMCFRRDLLGLESDHPLLFSEGIYIEDEEFVTRLVWQAGKVGVSDCVGYAYVQREDSTTNKRNAEHVEQLFQDYFTVLDKLSACAADEPMPRDGFDRKLHYLSVDILRHALRGDDWQQRFSDCSSKLKARSLYPLPSAKYSEKYRMFRILSNNNTGIKVLRFFEKKNG